MSTELLTLSEGISYDDAYQLAISLMNPRSLEFEAVKKLIGTACVYEEDDDGIKILRPTGRGLLGTEITFENFRKRNQIYCLQQCLLTANIPDDSQILYRPYRSSTLSMIDFIEYHGRQAPNPDREVNVLRMIFNEIIPIEVDHPLNAFTTLMYNTFVVHTKLFGFVMNAAAIPYMEPEYSVNDAKVDFAGFLAFMIEAKAEAVKSEKLNFIAVECGNDENHVGAQWLDPKEASDPYPLTTLLNIAQSPTIAFRNIAYPGVIVHENYMSNTHILFNVNSVKYILESAPEKEYPNDPQQLAAANPCQDGGATASDGCCSAACSHEQGKCHCNKTSGGTCSCKSTVKVGIPRGKRGKIDAKRKNYCNRKKRGI